MLFIDNYYVSPINSEILFVLGIIIIIIIIIIN
jgi:hypothetical protein